MQITGGLGQHFRGLFHSQMLKYKALMSIKTPKRSLNLRQKQLSFSLCSSKHEKRNANSEEKRQKSAKQNSFTSKNIQLMLRNKTNNSSNKDLKNPFHKIQICRPKSAILRMGDSNIEQGQKGEKTGRYEEIKQYYEQKYETKNRPVSPVNTLKKQFRRSFW